MQGLNFTRINVCHAEAQVLSRSLAYSGPMQWLSQLTNVQQLLLVLGLSSLILLGWVLYWLARLLDIQLREQQLRIQHQQSLQGQLQEIERRGSREQIELRELLSERIAKGMLAQQRLLHGMQQSQQVHSDKLGQTLERRFADILQNLGGDASRLRLELLEQFEALKKVVSENLADGRLQQQEKLGELGESITRSLARQRESFDERQAHSLSKQAEALQSGMGEVRKQVAEALSQARETV